MRVINFRTEGLPPGAIFIGRPSPFGNPFIIGKHGDRDEVCWKFELWVTTGDNSGNRDARPMARQLLLDRLPLLKGKDLVCFCAPLRCHGHVLMRLANQ